MLSTWLSSLNLDMNISKIYRISNKKLELKSLFYFDYLTKKNMFPLWNRIIMLVILKNYFPILHFLHCNRKEQKATVLENYQMQIASKLLFRALSALAFTEWRMVKITISCPNFHVIKITTFLSKPTKSFFMFSSLQWEEGQTSLQSGYKMGWAVFVRIILAITFSILPTQLVTKLESTD